MNGIFYFFVAVTLFEKSLAKTFGYQSLFSYYPLLVKICRNYEDIYRRFFEKSLAKTFGYQALFSYYPLLVEICRNYGDIPH